MKRMKTFFKYALWIILFFIFSEFLINVGLQSTYKAMKSDGDIPQEVNVEYAESTLVNGKIRGTIDTDNGNLNGKYLRTDFFSDRGNLLGTKYTPIQGNVNTGLQRFETLFKLQGVKSYNMSIVDSKEVEEIELVLFEPTKKETIIQTMWVLLLFIL